MESRGFELAPQVVEEPLEIGVRVRPEQPFHGMHSKANGFHVKGADGASQRLGLREHLIAGCAVAARSQGFQQVVNLGERGRGAGHTTTGPWKR